jgi:hypothetical protein
MKKLKQQSFSYLGLSNDRILTKSEMRLIFGGQEEELPPDEGGGGSGACLGCTENRDCAQVNKGDCNYCATHGKKCCSGWHSHS